MSDQSIIAGRLGDRRPSRWAIAAFAASCSFTGGALLLLVLTWLA